MASFYGGKQGITYHIVERYDQIFFDIDNQQYIKIIGDVVSNIQENKIFSVTIGDNVSFYMATSPITNCSTASFSLILENNQAVQLKGMVNCFSKGGAYTDVNYGEYVIIDTILNLHRYNDPQNGLLYRRGFQYNQIIENSTYQYPGGGAIYVGQIVGPPGKNTLIKAANWTQPSEQQEQEEEDLSSSSIANLIPGIIVGSPATFNKDITLKVINTKDSYGNIESAQLQFQTPYPVIRLSAQSVNILANSTAEVTHSYYSETGQSTSTTWAAGGQNGTVLHAIQPSTAHPFYYDYQIAVPKGEPGIWEINSFGDNLYVKYADDIIPSQGIPTTFYRDNNNKIYYEQSEEENRTPQLWYLFSTSQGAYHIVGTATTQELIGTYANGLPDPAQAGWAIQSENEILYAYDYLGKEKGIQTQGFQYLQNSWWYKAHSYQDALEPYKFLATTTSAINDFMQTPTFGDLGYGGLIFKIDTSSHSSHDDNSNQSQ